MTTPQTPSASPDVDDLKITPTESLAAVLPGLRVRVITSNGDLIEASARLTTRTQRGDLTYGQLSVGDEILLELDGKQVWEAIVSVIAI